jgi:hypothetical protein
LGQIGTARAASSAARTSTAGENRLRAARRDSGIASVRDALSESVAERFARFALDSAFWTLART